MFFVIEFKMSKTRSYIGETDKQDHLFIHPYIPIKRYDVVKRCQICGMFVVVKYDEYKEWFERLAKKDSYICCSCEETFERR
jgi:hypothetical protein